MGKDPDLQRDASQWKDRARSPGQKRTSRSPALEDLAGADYHLFTGEDEYVWNNRQGDSPLLFVEATKTTIDKASYDSNPPEGVVLVRAGDKLVAPVSRAANW
jgi:hypothetical protein